MSRFAPVYRALGMILMLFGLTLLAPPVRTGPRALRARGFAFAQPNLDRALADLTARGGV